ncbi:hypothetical protein XENORESO_002172, partial [Xenotaenia resolanae]
SQGDLTVVLGAHDLSKGEKSQQRIKVAKFFPHPKYTGKYDFDIMLLKLANKAKLNKYVQLLELPKKEKKIPANLECLVAGWGKTGRNESISTVLKEATEMTQFKIECDTIWKEIFTSQQMICTKFNKKKGGICQVNGPKISHAVHQDASKQALKQQKEQMYYSYFFQTLLQYLKNFIPVFLFFLGRFWRTSDMQKQASRHNCFHCC